MISVAKSFDLAAPGTRGAPNPMQEYQGGLLGIAGGFVAEATVFDFCSYCHARMLTGGSLSCKSLKYKIYANSLSYELVREAGACPVRCVPRMHW
jgi:hypothetical protein